MTAITTINLADGVRIVVPDSLEHLTHYVLREQQDWFEDEIRFLRRLLRPGEKVVDIGANCGVYALSMARTVGPSGRVWAFEPAAGTAALLAAGIAANGFAQVVLVQSAVSSASGTGQLSTNANAELNTLIHGAAPAGASEAVPLVTLDACLETHGWREIDFVKVDAEGEEAAILQGGRRFFAERSPLVQYEVGVRGVSHKELVQDFTALGYGTYRLVPGLGLLVPFDTDALPDGYLMNLFCCKPDRSRRLAERGYLLEGDVPVAPANLDAYGWRRRLGGLPYGSGLAAEWEKTVARGGSAEVERALALHALSRDASRTSGERFAALEGAFIRLRNLCEVDPSGLRMASLARVAADYGDRSLSVQSLRQLSAAIIEHGEVDAREPFLAPGERFDAIAPGDNVRDWVLAAALEEFERRGSFSSFFTGDSGRKRLEMIRALGFGSAEMARRLDLLQQRYPRTKEQQP